MIGVLIFAVDASLRRTLEQLSQKDPTIAIVGIANDQSSLLSLAATSHVDVVLTQEMPSAEMFADLRVLHDDAAWVLFQDPTEGRGVLEALGAGASAMLPPIADLVEITATIKMVDNGLVVFPKQVLAALPSAPKISNGIFSQEADNDHRRLSKREIAVLTAMTDGLSNKAIARRLGISFHTVKFHVASILEKLEAESRTEAVFKAAQLGIVML
jgi:two-component system, NarL family, response regulator YdfI